MVITYRRPGSALNRVYGWAAEPHKINALLDACRSANPTAHVTLWDFGGVITTLAPAM